MSKLANYFTKADRKKLFFDYLKLVGILEIIIFIVVVLWASDDKYHRVQSAFPWREYVFVAFAFPIVFTFLMGVIITGFNYFLGGEAEVAADKGEAPINQMDAVISQIKRLPYLSLLFLLLVTIFALYNLNHIMAWLGSLGYNTFRFLSYVLAGLGVIVVIYLMFFLFFKYRLNHKHMKYQYYSDISAKHGLIILDDQTVLHKNGNLLVKGRRWRGPEAGGDSPRPEGVVCSGACQPRPPADAQTLMPPTSAGRGARSAACACRILIMAALPREVRPFSRQVKAKARRDLGLPAWEWPAGAAVVALSGMGEVAARRAGETLVGRCRPQLLVSLGFGGALTPGLAAGDLVLGETFWRYNPDTRELKAGPHPACPRPLPRLCGALEKAGLTAVTGSLVSTSRIIHKGRHGGVLAGLPRPVLDLETVVLAEMAAAQGLAFLSLRAITDAVAEEIPGFIHAAGDQGASVGVRAALGWLAADFRRLEDLLHLWRRSRRAALALARALTVLWPLLLAAGGQLESQPAQEGEVDEDPHPAQAGLPDEEGHGQVEAQDAQIESGAQEGLPRKAPPAPIPPGGRGHPGGEKVQDPDES